MIVRSLIRYFTGISTSSTYSAWSGDSQRSRHGRPSPNACADTRTGHTLCGSGCRAQSIVRRPTQTTGSAPASSTRTRSPTRRSSTATSPHSVAIRVLATKHGVTPLTEISDPSVTDEPNCSVPTSTCDGPNSVNTCDDALKPDDTIDTPGRMISSPALKLPMIAANPPSVPMVSTPVPSSNDTLCVASTDP